jgi:hypothetical protein
MNKETQAGFYTVAVYIKDRHYGGPEEGGWYYEAGVPCMEPVFAKYLKAFDYLSDAVDYAATLNDTAMREWNEGRADISSVLSEGQFVALWSEGLPEPFPHHHPHYE